MLSGKPEEERRELKSWYEHGISISTWVCENCGDAIPNFSEEARYSAQAHLLPKHLFASVKTHPHNRLHLGNRFGCNCHDKYDLSFENAIRMPVMEIAVVRFDKLIPHISSSEVRYLPTLFRQHYELKTIL